MSAPFRDATTYTGLAAILSGAGLDDDPAAVQGAISGALCRLLPEQFDPTQLLEESETAPNARVRETLHRLTEDTLAMLADSDMGYTPLLPEDGELLALRARALGLWCEGFLYGLAGHAHLDIERVSEEVRELVSDFTEFTRVVYAEQDDLEVEEGAYAELVEYIRVGAQLIYMELHPRPTPAAGEQDEPTIH